MFRRDQRTTPYVCFLLFALLLLPCPGFIPAALAQTYDFDEGMRTLTSGLLTKKGSVLKGRKIAVFGIVEGNTGEEWRITSYIEDEIVNALLDEGYRVVERSRIDDVLKKEIKKGADLWFDGDEAARFGKLLGADAVVTGKYTQWGNNTLRVNVRCISVADGEVLAGSRVNVLTDRIHGLLKKDEPSEEKAGADRNSYKAATDRQVERIKQPIEASDFTEDNQRRPIEGKEHSSAKPEEKMAQSLGKPGEIRTFTVKGVSFKMVRIPAGEFTMGSPSNEPDRDSDETQNRVRISKDFWMGRTEVTQGLWKAVMGSNPSHFSNCGDDCPVEKVSWDDCHDFIRKLNGMVSGGGFRLPTEAEWEYACRAGTTTPFNTGRCLNGGQANYNGNYPLSGCSKGEYRERTVKAGSFSPNAWGLFDMHGNVWEWCEDWYGNYPSGSVTDPIGAFSGSDRIIRGGGWNDNARHCRSANRNWHDLGFRYFSIGFRLALH